MTFLAVVLLVIFTLLLFLGKTRAMLGIMMFAPVFSLFPNTSIVAGLNPIELSAGLVALSLLREAVMGSPERVLNGGLIVGFIMLHIIAATYAIVVMEGDVMGAVDSFLKTTIAYGIYWLSRSYVRSDEERNTVYSGIAVSTIAVGVVFGITYYVGGYTVDVSRGIERYAGLYNDPGTPAYYAVISLIVHSYLMERDTWFSKRKWLYWLNHVLVGFIIIVTLTRSAMIMYIIYMLMWHGVYKKILWLIVPMIIAAAIILYNEDESFRGRFEQEITYVQYGDVPIHRLGMGRVERWDRLFDMYAYEYTTYEKLFGRYVSYAAHNNYLAYLLQVGLIGLLLFIVILVRFLIKSIGSYKRARDPEAMMTLMYLVILVVYAFTGHPFYYASLLWFLMFMLSSITSRIGSGGRAGASVQNAIAA